MRNLKFAPGEYYHLFNRGVNKQKIFLEERDYIRFLFLTLANQGSSSFINLGRQVTHYVKHRVFNIEPNEILARRQVGLLAFALMPNHFHILVQELSDGGVSSYMQRTLNAYTKYVNVKYNKSGHIFQGPFKAVHIGTNEQLLHTSAYIHKNPKELKNGKFEKYRWSSLMDYSSSNRWGLLLDRSVVLEQFDDASDYRIFIRTSPAKDKDLDLV